MSKMNAVRLININYNNNAIRISDECFHFNGESTLLSLRNGGGKSVLVQMMTAPFVHKRYRDAKDRPFESYFTTSKPSFILVEWKLNQGAGYVLTGMMVRRNQEIGENHQDALDMMNFVSEYREPCLLDIHHLPVVEKGKKEMVLKNFAACRQMFESYKKDRSVQFFYYDMNNSAQSRQYFDKLMEYQINYKEWETIIKKVNLKESGLSDLFADCRDEKGLVEKWFLDAVESKLNKERNRMKEFQSILEKYVGQYKDNQSKIKRRDTIRLFRQEAEEIHRRARVYEEAQQQEKAQENLVAQFLAKLNALHDDTEKNYEQRLGEIEEISQKMERVEYERLSSEIHELERTMRFHTSNRDMIEMERDMLEREAEETERKLHLFLCAKQQEFVDGEKQELEIVRQKLEVSHKKEEELEPERKKLGFLLRLGYEQLLEENQGKQEANQQKRQETSTNIKEEEQRKEELETELRKNASREGALKSKAEIYDQQETQYVKRYGETLARNILGEYEPGTLEILEDSYKRELDEAIRLRIRNKNQLEKQQSDLRKMERDLEDIRSELIRKNMSLEQQQNLQSRYEQELEIRRVILKYLNLDERDVFDTEKILNASERMLQEITGKRRNLEKEEDALQKEYVRLTQGKTLELPKELEEEFTALGIHVVYGMEWLQKNGYTKKQNEKLVRDNPFLPYALILSRKELEKLKEQTGSIYTSFPVPIVVREEIGKQKKTDGGVLVCLGDVSFYVLFNENLLDEEKLILLIKEKEQQIRKKKEAIAVRQKEYEEYFKRQEVIENQEVSRERYDSNANQMQELQEQIEKQTQNQRKLSDALAQLRNEMEELEKEIRKTEKDIDAKNRRQEDFARLVEAYQTYMENRAELEICQKQMLRIREKQVLVKNKLEKLRESQRSLDALADVLDREQQHLQEKCAIYKKYEKAQKDAECSEELSLEEMEVRYTAITGNLSMKLQELEKQEERAAKRYEDALDELMHLRKKYHLKDRAWRDIVYSRKEEAHQEILLEDYKRKIENKRMLWGEEDKQIAIVDQQMKDRIKRMKSECGQEAVLSEQEIESQDFEARRNELVYQQKLVRKEADSLKVKLQSYDENLTALSEYSEFPLRNEVEWEEDFAQMTSRELRNFKGILIRDYNQNVLEKQKAKEKLTQILNQIVRMEAFQDDFYRKPLENMLSMTDEAGGVLRQLNTTLQSYENLMEKLEVDISLVEKEKNKIVEILGDYLKEVHQNLGKIDHNSTITIREKPVKMLRIGLPDWEENENLYQIRLNDMIDEITLKGIEIFERNENAQEYFGTKITTKNLYDTVVGIGNVQIRLYKIEEHREYSITWAEVARNSGGEGFLSAFVILSSLLYYMRRDDTDLFADKNEGKVLLMDNPFAQTNASHLLKPLMDMAKKTNTQLICLTGLGGESIYNRFDNIYVLNLIAASLRNGMQYLKGDHLRGNEPETMIVSQIEVMEQQELIF